MKVVGIDIAKHHFDLHLLPQGKTAHYPNNTQGIADGCQFLAQVRPEAIVLEATGGYEQALAIELQTMGLPVIVVNPRRVRDFARSRADWPRPTRLTRESSPSSPRARVSRPGSYRMRQARQRMAWIARKRQLVEMHVAESNRLEHAVDRVVVQSLRRILAVLEKQIAAIEGKIAEPSLPIPSSNARPRSSIRCPASAPAPLHAGDRTAGTGTGQSSRDRHAGRTRADESRQRPVPGQTHDRRRTGSDPHAPCTCPC